jgi:ribosomal protein S18 acetylase RimI-like enzyme
MSAHAGPRSLLWTTNVQVLPRDRVVERRDGYLAITSPGNPAHWWGNLLLFDDPPAPGDGSRWEALFAAEFANRPEISHRTFAWDRTDGVLGCAREELVARGYELELTVCLRAAAAELHEHPRENREVLVRALDPREGCEEGLWQQVIELQLGGYERPIEEPAQRAFCIRRQLDLRELFRAGAGAWYVALTPREDRVVGSLGIVTVDGRARYETVDTAAAYRRQGICSRLLVAAARHACEQHGARELVIGADPEYHAQAIYESVGFRAVERQAGVLRQAKAPSQPA